VIFYRLRNYSNFFLKKIKPIL